MEEVSLIRAAPDDRGLIGRFIRVPWYVHREVYPNNKWVPPLVLERRRYLDPRKNPLFEHASAAFWLANHDGRDIGRIAAIEDEDFARAHHERVGYFGMFECADDEDAAKALVERAAAWLRERGCTRMLGPLDLTMSYMCGTLVEGFGHAPGVNMPWNPPYYVRLMEASGLTKAKDLFQWTIDLSRHPIPDRVVRIAEKIRQRERVSVRKFRFDDWDTDIGHTLRLYNEAWRDNWGFVPLREKEYRHIAKDLKAVLHPDLGLIAEVDGDPVAFALSILDINDLLRRVDGKLFPTGALHLAWELMVRKRFTRGRLILLGIKDGYRRRGLDSLLMVDTFENARRLGLSGGQIGWTLEDNDLVNRAIEGFGCERTFTYRIWERAL
jgi:GNAT superfamily N-acetyltransferase